MSFLKVLLDVSAWIAEHIWSVLRWVIRLLLIAAFSLAVAMTTLTVDAVAEFAWRAVMSVSSFIPIRGGGAAEASPAQLRAELARERRRNAGLETDVNLLRGERQALVETNARLRTDVNILRGEGGALRAVNGNLEDMAAGLRRTIENQNRELRAQADKVSLLTRRMASRTARVASTNAASTVGESIPIYGIGVIVAATTYELLEACETMKDLRELEAAFDPDVVIDPEEVCGIKLPTREELWQMVKSSPRVAWEGSKPLYNELPSWSDLDVGGRLGRGWASFSDWVWPD